MKAENIVLLGVKGTVLAFCRDTGDRLWSQDVDAGFAAGSGFVTLMADETRVFAHSCGELFCLDLFTGELLWHDKLAGLGYGLATIALPGSLASNVSEMAQIQHQHASGAAAIPTAPA